MVQLPRPTLSGSSDHREPIVLTATADGSGRATASTKQVPPAASWLIDYVTVSTENSTECAVQVYDTVEDFARLFDGSSTLGGGGVAAYQPARVLPSGSTLLIVWSGAAAGEKVAARVEYRELLDA